MAEGAVVIDGIVVDGGKYLQGPEDKAYPKLPPGYKVPNQAAGTPGKRCCILSIDGGGLRGIIPAVILTELEKMLQEKDGNPNARLCDYFDFFAGTSTGGLLATCLTVDNGSGRPLMTAQETIKFYQDNGAIIFPPKPLGVLAYKKFVDDLLFGPKYSPKPLETILQNMLGDRTFMDCVKPLLMTAYDIALQQPLIFSKVMAQDNISAHNCYLRDVCRATSAAPTFFPPHFFRPAATKLHKDSPIERLTSRGAAIVQDRRTGIEVVAPSEFNVIDGGVFANNPTNLAVSQVLTHQEHPELYGTRGKFTGYSDLLVLSLGTGDELPKFDVPTVSKWGTLSWTGPVINILYNGMPAAVDLNLSVAFDAHEARQNYFRIQVDKLPNRTYELDNSDKENLRELIKVGVEALDAQVREHNANGLVVKLPETNRFRLENFADWLVEEKRARDAMASA